MPLVPTTVSRNTAAIVSGPSSLMTSLRPFSTSARGRRGGARVFDDVLEAVERLGDGARLLLAPAVRVRVADHAHDAGLVGQAAGVARRGHPPRGRPGV